MIKTSTYEHTQALDQIAKEFGAKSATIDFARNSVKYDFGQDTLAEAGFSKICVTMANIDHFGNCFNWMDSVGHYSAYKVSTIADIMKQYLIDEYITEETAIKLAELCKMGIAA